MSLAKRILVAVDYNPISDRAMTAGLELARHLGAVVEVVHVCTMPYADPLLHGRADDQPNEAGNVEHQANLYEKVRASAVEEMKAFLQRHAGESEGLKVEYSVISGDPQEAVSQRAKEWKAELVVIGTHGRRALERWFLGSVAEFTVRHSPCPVLVIRGKETD